MKVTLVRHTSLAIAPNICYGQSDIDVSVNFEVEHARLAEKLSAYQFDAIYASPLQRCQKLALRLKQNQTITLDDRLKELHFGDWEMQAWDDIPRDIFDAWAQNYAHLSPPNGETFADLHQRATEFIQETRQIFHGKHILVVTHGGWIRALIAEVLQMPLKGLFRITIDHASVTQLEFNGDIPRLHLLNH